MISPVKALGAYVWLEIKENEEWDYQTTLIANQFQKQSPRYAVDSRLENEGWEMVAKVNGGFFWQNGSNYEANGTEIVHGEAYEVSYDSQYNNVTNIGGYWGKNNRFIFDSKGNMENYWQNTMWQVTAGVGLLPYVSDSISNAATQSNNRTFVGVKNDGTLVIGAVKSGYSQTASQMASFLRDSIGCEYAASLDGGGSTYFGTIHNGFSDESSKWDGRTVKNIIAIYRKKKNDSGNNPDPEQPEIGQKYVTFSKPPVPINLVKDKGKKIVFRDSEGYEFKELLFNNLNSDQPIKKIYINENSNQKEIYRKGD